MRGLMKRPQKQGEQGRVRRGEKKQRPLNGSESKALGDVRVGPANDVVG